MKSGAKGTLKLLSLIGTFFLFQLFVLLFSQTQVFAQDDFPDSFIVEVNPSSFGVNEAVDLVIKAVDAAGQTVKNYNGDVYMEINIIDPDDYVLPSDGFYTFLEQDQGVKMFSKGLTIKIPGTYKIQIYDIIDDMVSGQATVIVGEIQEQKESEINLIAPVAGGVELKQQIDVIAQSPELPNSRFQVFLNDVLKSEGISTEKGDVTTYVDGASPGQNTLQVKVVDVNGLVLGQSPLITFNFQTTSDTIFKNIEVLPSSTVKQGDKITFKVTTDDSVSSAELRFSDGNYSPLDLISVGTFSKTIAAETPGTINVTLALIAAGNKKIYENITTFSVGENTAIGSMKFYTDSVDKTALMVMWGQIGQAAKYKVEYGTSPNVLSFSQDVSVNEIKISNLDPNQKYYIKVTPVDLSGNPVGSPSEVEEVVSGHLGPPSVGDETEPPSCVVKGMSTRTGMIGDKYYLMRDEVENVERYII